ncbi:chemotaxis protein CheW [Dactylosporangium fulvum]|uniref:Chemotaxis protein CheW n=1 Tax=Dactylosporangium fulvum TaxID=53359 RepID=A0ABY5WCE6_9ACTN|nr:chemotaxis protein CheW [Dactylosporangium fulvum]UWP86353.1 chemotaxis protein CheW [Dactylosporangium fulvum]
MSAVLHGVFTVADVHVALPLSELREVIPCPPAFDPLLAAAPGLVGAVNLRHQIIPVLDLRRLLGLPDGDGTDVVVVVACDGSVFGLLASAVHGVVGIDGDARLGMTVNSEPLFSCTFERPDDGAVVCVLDCAAVRRLPGMVVADDTGGPSGVVAPARTGGLEPVGGRTMMMLLRCGEIGVCVDVSHIHSVVPELILKSSPLDGPAVHGVVELGEQYVATVDTLAVLGLGTLAPIDVKRGVALAYDRGLLTFAVTEVTAIVGVTGADVLPVPSFGLPSSDYVVGILPGQAGGSYLVVDGDRLRADPQLGTIAALGTPVAGRAPERPRPDAADRPAGDGRVIEHVVRKYLTYHAGVEVATPLTQVTEIVPHPGDVIPFVGGGPLRGVFTHHRASVPLICLATLLGRPVETDPATARVLLVADGDDLVGFIVPGLRAIEESIWEERRPAEPDAPVTLAGSPLVKIGLPGGERMLPRIDLRRAARTMVGDREHHGDQAGD